MVPAIAPAPKPPPTHTYKIRTGTISRASSTCLKWQKVAKAAYEQAWAQKAHVSTSRVQSVCHQLLGAKPATMRVSTRLQVLLSLQSRDHDV